MLAAFRPKTVGQVFNEVPAPIEGEMLYDCTFNKLNGGELKNCTLYGSKFAMTKPEHMVGLTITLDCATFDTLELSPEVFDYMLLLLCRTKGNNDKRLAIIEKVVGHDRSVRLLKETELLENH